MHCKITFAKSLHSAYALVRTNCLTYADGNHGRAFRTILHAVHRRSWTLFELRAIGKRYYYERNHFMSHIWDEADNKRHGLFDQGLREGR